MGSQGGQIETRGKVGDRPAPTLTLDQFREQFTEEHREALAAAIVETQRRRFSELMQEGVRALSAHRVSHDEQAKAREALQLLGALHPQPYEW